MILHNPPSVVKFIVANKPMAQQVLRLPYMVAAADHSLVDIVPPLAKDMVDNIQEESDDVGGT